MKITLEFDSEEELELYIQTHRTTISSEAKGFDIENPGVGEVSQHFVAYTKPGKKRQWSTYEIDMLLRLFPVKSVKWIASYMGRKVNDVNNKVFNLRKSGVRIPAKRHKTAKVVEQ